MKTDSFFTEAENKGKQGIGRSVHLSSGKKLCDGILMKQCAYTVCTLWETQTFILGNDIHATMEMTRPFFAFRTRGEYREGFAWDGIEFVGEVG